jgi:tetratricopeptide (TPR) repeat protein
LASTSYGQPESWEATVRAAEVSLSRGDVAEAESLLTRAVQLAEQTPSSDEDLALSLTMLASFYHGAERYQEAEPLLLRALPLTEKTRGPDHPDVARILSNLGLLNHSRSDYVRAREFYQRSLAMLERSLGKESPELILTLNNLGALAMAEGRDSEAEAFYQRALAIADRSPASVGPQLAVALRGYAELLKRLGRYKEAREFERRAKWGPATSWNGLLVLVVSLGVVTTVAAFVAVGLVRKVRRRGALEANSSGEKVAVPIDARADDGAG